MAMRIRNVLAGVAMSVCAMTASAQPGGPDGYGWGPMTGAHGMMAPGYGAGMMGPGYGAGMMGAYGGGMMGPGYGAGMMGWHGGGMMQGPGFGLALQRRLDLTDQQRKTVDAIHDDFAKSQWDIAAKMHGEMAVMRELMLAQPRDRAAIEAAYKRMSALREQRFSAMLTARERIDATLTPEQRQKLRRAEAPFDVDE